MKKNDPITILGILVAAWCFFGGDLGGLFVSPFAPPPFPADKLCVLVVEESQERASLPIGQREAMLAVDGPGSIRGYVDAQGGEYLLWDKDQQPSPATPKWVAGALKSWDAAKGDKLPWIVAATPRTGFTRELPTDAAETVAALKRIGGE